MIGANFKDEVLEHHGTHRTQLSWLLGLCARFEFFYLGGSMPQDLEQQAALQNAGMPSPEDFIALRSQSPSEILQEDVNSRERAAKELKVAVDSAKINFSNIADLIKQQGESISAIEEFCKSALERTARAVIECCNSSVYMDRGLNASQVAAVKARAQTQLDRLGVNSGDSWVDQFCLFLSGVEEELPDTEIAGNDMPRYHSLKLALRSELQNLKAQVEAKISDLRLINDLVEQGIQAARADQCGCYVVLSSPHAYSYLVGKLAGLGNGIDLDLQQDFPVIVHFHRGSDEVVKATIKESLPQVSTRTEQYKVLQPYKRQNGNNAEVDLSGGVISLSSGHGAVKFIGDKKTGEKVYNTRNKVISSIVDDKTKAKVWLQDFAGWLLPGKFPGCAARRKVKKQYRYAREELSSKVRPTGSEASSSLLARLRQMVFGKSSLNSITVGEAYKNLRRAEDNLIDEHSEQLQKSVDIMSLCSDLHSGITAEITTKRKSSLQEFTAAGYKEAMVGASKNTATRFDASIGKLDRALQAGIITDDEYRNKVAVLTGQRNCGVNAVEQCGCALHDYFNGSKNKHESREVFARHFEDVKTYNLKDRIVIDNPILSHDRLNGDSFDDYVAQGEQLFMQEAGELYAAHAPDKETWNQLIDCCSGHSFTGQHDPHGLIVAGKLLDHDAVMRKLTAPAQALVESISDKRIGDMPMLERIGAWQQSGLITADQYAGLVKVCSAVRRPTKIIHTHAGPIEHSQGSRSYIEAYYKNILNKLYTREHLDSASYGSKSGLVDRLDDYVKFAKSLVSGFSKAKGRDLERAMSGEFESKKARKSCGKAVCVYLLVNYYDKIINNDLQHSIPEFGNLSIQSILSEGGPKGSRARLLMLMGGASSQHDLVDQSAKNMDAALGSFVTAACVGGPLHGGQAEKSRVKTEIVGTLDSAAHALESQQEEQIEIISNPLHGADIRRAS